MKAANYAFSIKNGSDKEMYNREADYVPTSMETAVLEAVENGIKSVELVLLITKMQTQTVMVKSHPSEDFNEPDLLCYSKPKPVYEQIGDPVCYLFKLVNERKIMEIEYCLPHMDYRTKSMFFPVGTKFKLSK